ncbi:MAG: flippase-like domain-containing protein [Actinomycetota bacterium]|nr:flippase-like domain-containing protein [Actinomycetota bacterium]
MSEGAGQPEGDGALEPPGLGQWMRDWRFWLGLGITLVSVWIAVRGIPIGEVIAAMQRANFIALLLLSAPFYTLSVYLRALRWRHLTDPITPIPTVALFRAASIGFLANNLLPLRMGEIIRSVTLANEAGVSRSAILGTVVIERVLDVVAVLLLAAASLSWVGSQSDAAGILQEGSILLLPVALAPLAVLAALRLWPETLIAAAVWCLRPAPTRARELAERVLRGFSDGLGALGRGGHLFWIAFHSALIWLVASTGPMLIGFWAFGPEVVSFDSPWEMIVTSWVLLAAVGVAVALPSAPGFIGPYQLAFQAVLVRFGVDPAEALAMGVLVWAAFWLTLTLQGVVVLRASRMTIAEMMRRSG